MTLWVHTLDGRQLTSHQDDHSLMHRFAAELDTICATVGVNPLSSFLDYTDINANMSEDAEVSDEPDPETGWSYGIDAMTWFAAKDGLGTLSALRAHLADGTTDSIPPNQIADLLAELDSCIAKLTEPASREAKFHLAVVM